MSPSHTARDALNAFDATRPLPEDRQTPEFRAMKAAAESEALLDPAYLIGQAAMRERWAAQPDSSFSPGAAETVRKAFSEQAVAFRARAAELTAQYEAEAAVAPLARSHRVAA